MAGMLRVNGLKEKVKENNFFKLSDSSQLISLPEISVAKTQITRN